MADLHLTDYNESERADYMVVMAAFAGADGHVSSEEILALRELCQHFVLGPDARGRVMAATTPGSENMGEVTGRLEDTGLKFSLILDLCAMAWQDGQVASAEDAEIRRLAGDLGLAEGQVAGIVALAEALQKGESVSKALADVEAAGVPGSALALSATLYGMSVAGVAGAREAMQAL